jgi:hypothetical protein
MRVLFAILYIFQLAWGYFYPFYNEYILNFRIKKNFKIYG